MNAHSVPLVGRRELLSELRDTLESSRAGAFQFVAVVGDPGAGKTRLLTELAGTARNAGCLTLWGRAAEFEQVSPFSALVDALDAHLEARPITADPLLASVFPALGAQDRDEDSSGLVRYRIYRAIMNLLGELARPSGLLLVLDDVHWADPSTIEFLEHVARHPSAAGLMLVIAYRPNQAPPRLALGGRQVQVGPLTEAESHEFLGPGVPRLRRDALYEASGGNPFYLQALARVEAGELPVTPHAVLQLELASLSPDARLVVQGAAVAGDEFEPALAAVAARAAMETTLAAIDELVARDLVRPQGGRFRFRHPLLRQAAYESAAAGWRVGAHARVADRLAELDAPATARALHVERSGSFGDAAAVDVLVKAARAVATTAPGTAAHWLGVAIGLMPGDGGDERIWLLLELARAQTVSGLLTEGRENAYEVLRRLPRDDYVKRAFVARFCALVERLLDQTGQARAVLLAELREIPDPRLPAALPMRLRLVAESLMRGDHRAAQAVLDFMPEQPARGSDGFDSGLFVAVAALRPMASYAAGQVETALQHLGRVTEALLETPEDRLLDWMDMIPWLCWSELWLGRPQSAADRFERAVRVTRKYGQTFIVTNMLAGLARTYLVLGRLAEGAVAAEESGEVALLMQSRYAIVVAKAQRSLLAGAIGDTALAVRLGEEAALSGAGAGEWPGAQAWFAYVSALAGAGRTQDLGPALIRVEEAFGAERLDQFSMLQLCEALAGAWSAKDQERARAWADRAAAIAHQALPFNAGYAALADAHALSGAAAEKRALTAADIFEAAGLRLDTARALLRAGTAAMDDQRKRDALPHLEAAAAGFAACGASGRQEDALREMRRRVADPRRTANANGLTAKEQEVAELVAAGASNKEIAARLFVSVRTVETHLSRIYVKLGVNGRVALANVFREPI